jgi:hypothetical protein
MGMSGRTANGGKPIFSLYLLAGRSPLLQFCHAMGIAYAVRSPGCWSPQTSQRSEDEHDMDVPSSQKWLLAAAAALLLTNAARCQEALCSSCDLWREPLLPGSLNAMRLRCMTASDTSSNSGRENAVRLFRMTTGYLSGSVAAIDMDAAPSVYDQTGLPSDAADGPNRLSVIMGNDNPYLDFRRPGDPGGVGYLRVQSQLQFLDTGRTGCTIGLRAATPAGLEYDGLQNGPTFVAPNLAWFYDLGDGVGLHGFVGKNVRAAGDWTDTFGRNVEYGFAMHRPMPTADGGMSRNLFLFIQALGRLRPDFLSDARRPAVWDVVPGLHYRLNDNWWMSGGVIVPVGTSRSDLGTWQVTCSWQF